MVSQLLGACAALPIAYAMRVTVAGEGDTSHFEPAVNSFAPPLLVSTDGKPAYGQVMFAETVGTCLLVLVILLAKREIAENDRDPALWLLAMAIGLQVCQDMFHDVSGGFVNPALAFG